MNASLPKIWRGIIPPLVTPLADRDTLDRAGLERLLEHVLAGGVSGVFVLGTTGEGPNLAYGLRRELVEHACRVINGRVPVMVGITDTSAAEALALARWAAGCGAAALVSSTPYYFPLTQDELASYLERLAARLPLPLVLYNMPAMTKVSFAPATVARLMQQPKIIGIKDTSGELDNFRHYTELAHSRNDWTMLIGPERLLVESVRLGGHGGINGGSNLMPRLLVDLYEAAAGNDGPRVAELQAQANILGKLYDIERHGAAVTKGLKCALSLLGICGAEMAEPFLAMNAAQRDQVRQLLVELKLL